MAQTPNVLDMHRRPPLLELHNVRKRQNKEDVGMTPFLLSPGDSRNGDGNPSPLPVNVGHRKNSEQSPDTPIGML